jgi:hypothetical protein
MNSLYDKNWRYTIDADRLDRAVNAAIQPIFQEFLKEGFSPREISHLIQQVVTDIECESILFHPVTYTRQQVIKAKNKGKDFWCWYMDNQQHIFQTPTPGNIKDVVLVLPREEEIPNLPIIMRGL